MRNPLAGLVAPYQYLVLRLITPSAAPRPTPCALNPTPFSLELHLFRAIYYIRYPLRLADFQPLKLNKPSCNVSYFTVLPEVRYPRSEFLVSLTMASLLDIHK